jgi:hypothetical protein
MTGATRFTVRASLLALVSAALGFPCVWGRWEGAEAWLIFGWGATAVVSISTGAWLARAHGTPGPGVLAALVTGILARMVLVVVGLFLAGRQDHGFAWGFLSGFALAFVPLLAHEVVWSIRAGRQGR